MAKARAKEKGSKSRIEKVRELLEQMETRLKEQKEVSISDFIRLTQLEHALEQEERPGGVIAGWEDLAERRDSDG